jgi:hypothetical protein
MWQWWVRRSSKAVVNSPLGPIFPRLAPIQSLDSLRGADFIAQM